MPLLKNTATTPATNLSVIVAIIAVLFGQGALILSWATRVTARLEVGDSRFTELERTDTRNDSRIANAESVKAIVLKLQGAISGLERAHAEIYARVLAIDANGTRELSTVMSRQEDVRRRLDIIETQIRSLNERSTNAR